MFDAADILVDGSHCGGHGLVERLVIRLAREADEIPAGSANVSSVSVSRRAPFRRSSGRRHVSRSDGGPADYLTGVERDIFGQKRAAGSERPPARNAAMDDRDRRAPVTLTRYAPVAQAKDRWCLNPSRVPILSIDSALASSTTAVQELAVTSLPGRYRLSVLNVFGAPFGCHDAQDRQHIFAREIEVALVAPGGAEQRAVCSPSARNWRRRQRQVSRRRTGAALQSRCRSPAFPPCSAAVVPPVLHCSIEGGACGLLAASVCAIGWSAAIATKLAPKMVSGRVE